LISASVPSEVLNYSESFDKGDCDQGNGKHGIHIVQVLVLNRKLLVLNCNLLILNVNQRGNMNLDFFIGILQQNRTIEELNLDCRRVISRDKPLERHDCHRCKNYGCKTARIPTWIWLFPPWSHFYSPQPSLSRLEIESRGCNFIKNYPHEGHITVCGRDYRRIVRPNHNGRVFGYRAICVEYESNLQSSFIGLEFDCVGVVEVDWDKWSYHGWRNIDRLTAIDNECVGGEQDYGDNHDGIADESNLTCVQLTPTQHQSWFGSIRFVRRASYYCSGSSSVALAA